MTFDANLAIKGQKKGPFGPFLYGN